MAKSSRIRLSITSHSITGSDGRPFQPSKKFFVLYAFLGLRQLEDDPVRGGFVDNHEILPLPHWGGNREADSVGKEIKRHIDTQYKRNRQLLIEMQTKVKGPSRPVPGP